MIPSQPAPTPMQARSCLTRSAARFATCPELQDPAAGDPNQRRHVQGPQVHRQYGHSSLQRFPVHDVGTGDGIPQAAKPEYLDQSTANRFRTPPLWGLRFRYGLMHDGNSPGTDQAIERHGEEAMIIRQHYEHLTAAEKKQLQQFLNSL